MRAFERFARCEKALLGDTIAVGYGMDLTADGTDPLAAKNAFQEHWLQYLERSLRQTTHTSTIAHQM